MAKEKTGLASISEGRSDIHRIDPRKLKVRSGWNSRDFDNPENAQYIEEIAASIAEKGVLEPITVTWANGEALIDDGECRWRGAMLCIERGIDLKTVPVKTEDRYASEIDRLVNQRLRNSGKPFTVFEDAKHFHRLLTLGMKQDEIAKKANISAARVSQILEYNTMPEAVKKQVMNGNVSPTLAMETVKAQGTDAEQALLNGMKAAKKAGRQKVKPGDIEGSKRISIKKAVVDVFEYADVDDSDNEVIVIKMPAEHWETLRILLKL